MKNNIQSQEIVVHKNKMLTLKNYKEPLKKVKKGYFGYQGCLLSTIDGTKVQCHVCGELFISLQAHAHQAHGLLSKDYKKKFDLAHTTALISEVEREKRKQITLKFFANATSEMKAEWRRRRIEGMKKRWNKGTYFKIRLETKNKRGTCPDQLIEKIKEVERIKGRTPSLSEFIDETGGQRFKHLIFTTFGSWKNALKIAKLTPKERTEGGYRRYKTDELLEMVEMFAREHDTIPTATDCKRGFLPSYDVFLRRFGSMEQARIQAGIYNFITPVLK